MYYNEHWKINYRDDAGPGATAVALGMSCKCSTNMPRPLMLVWNQLPLGLFMPGSLSFSLLVHLQPCLQNEALATSSRSP